MTSRYAALTREQLAVVVPELLLTGHLIDRSGMAWALGAFGQQAMAEIAIEEWAGASPIYTRRMQRALDFVGSDVATIFKGMQLEIGAPPQFMDFRYWVEDANHGGFHLDHCGALLDVEPMGNVHVKAMCHDIEDPTFDATAVATNPRAVMRPVHRPPRVPSDRAPHCEWTVTIDETNPPVEAIPALAVVQSKHVAALELSPIDRSEEGLGDYSGPLVSDIDFAAFSHSALVRIADEVCVQMHLLVLSFQLAVRERAVDRLQADTIVTKQLTGIAGIMSERLARALGLEEPIEVLKLHPLLNPAVYVDASFGDSTVTVLPSPAHQDEAWIVHAGPTSLRPLQAAVRGVSPYLDIEVSGTPDDWTAQVVRRAEPAKEMDEVAVTRFSKGAAFAFSPRRSLPLTVV
ncbi:MAG: Uncharacterized protein JWO22_1030 [Frankiales bacterium]|nr:Uncharacterized protein [Frankiales bacterium]